MIRDALDSQTQYNQMDELAARLRDNTYPEILLAAREAAETIEALRRERDAEKEKARVLRVENNTVRMDLAAMTAERNELKANVWYLKGVRDEKLAASQAREQQLREALEEMRYSHTDKAEAMYQAALALPHDDTALRQYGAKLLRQPANHMMVIEDSRILLRMADELEGKK